MLLTDVKMSSYQPNNCTTDIKSIPFSETQKELMQKFNLAFYEAQTKNIEHENILETFDERYFNEIENYENDVGDTNCIFDLLLSKTEPTNVPSHPIEPETNFDYTDFCDTFEKVRKEGNAKRRGSVSTETVLSTETSNYSEYGIYYEHFDSNLRNLEDDDAKCDVDALELSEIDLTESLSNSSLDLENFDEISYEFEQGYQPNFKLPPVETIHKNCLNFSSLIRTSNPVSLHFDNEVKHTNTYGHIIGQQSINNNITVNYNIITQTNDDFLDDNQAVMTQNEALIYDDPLLSSSNIMIPKRERKNTTTSQDSEYSAEENDLTYNQLQCKWEHCFQMFDSQMALVKHIEKYHVELKRGEEFTCFWLDCPRKTKPFNARYKLLIHMRVHSLHKPNKCPFQGCHKAFSRLENLKIHQRSHTGERPYLCQFSNCTKSFSNSSDRAKHQRTHYDTKPYACQVTGCLKKYTDPSSLRKHVKNHTYEEQLQVKKKTQEIRQKEMNFSVCKKNSPLVSPKYTKQSNYSNFYTMDHSYSNNLSTSSCIVTSNIKQDLKLRLSEKISKERQLALN